MKPGQCSCCGEEESLPVCSTCAHELLETAQSAACLAIMKAALSALVASYDEREQDPRRLERALANARLVLKAANGDQS